MRERDGGTQRQQSEREPAREEQRATANILQNYMSV